MNAKEIKVAVSNLEKAQDDKTVLEILTSLDKEVKATESLLRVSLFVLFCFVCTH